MRINKLVGTDRFSIVCPSMPRGLIFGVLSLLVLACNHPKTYQESESHLFLDGDSMEFKGYIKMEDGFGPPGYGEDPKADLKVRFPVLQIAREIPIRMKDFDGTSVIRLKSFQLFDFSGKCPQIRQQNLHHSQVFVKGKLYRADFGWQHTDFWIDVESIRPTDNL